MMKVEVTQIYLFSCVSQGYVGSIPTEPNRSSEGRKETIFPNCTIPGGGYSGISHPDQCRDCKGRVTHIICNQSKCCC